MRNYIIIGAGAAGIAASEAIRCQDTAGRITLISEEAEGYYSRPGLAYYLTGEITEDQLFPFRERDFQRLNLQRVNGSVKRILPAEHRVELKNGQQLAYDRLLIATGAQAARVNNPGTNLQGVLKLDNLVDARRMVKYARRGKTLVVVGGGITALEIVEGMRSRGVKVIYFLRGDRYWSNVLDETESRIVEHRLKEEKVQIKYNTELEEVVGKRDQVIGVRTRDGQIVKCDLVAIAVGVVPRSGLAREAGLTVNKGIAVDERLRTSDPDIYAAGDVAEVFDPSIGRAILDSLWSPARWQGDAAGSNMAGVSKVYTKGVAFNVTRLAGLTTTIIGSVGAGREDADTVGIVRGDSEAWRQPPDAIAAQSGFDINRLRILVGKQRILGAMVIGDQRLSRPIHNLIVQQADIAPVREKLLQPDRPLPDIIENFWSAWRQNGHQ